MKSRSELSQELRQLERWLATERRRNSKFHEEYARLLELGILSELDHGAQFEEFQEKARQIELSAAPKDVAYVRLRVSEIQNRDEFDVGEELDDV